ncbi:kinase-like domain-containing protein [Xylariaceae sp. FL0804]|nr:kinase-like domain-containing protein [Xylariaceae sp. FL0804]
MSDLSITATGGSQSQEPKSRPQTHDPQDQTSNSAESGRQEYVWSYLQDEFGLENVSEYNKGGFHPIHLGDKLNDRFEVIHKLGAGGYGTWRAVKVMTANHSAKPLEERVLNHLLARSSVEELYSRHICLPLERFFVEGPNGRHLCQVMPIMGCPVSRWRRAMDKDDKEDSAAAVKNVCGQIARGLRFLHDNGVCHGDLRPSNILMKLDQEALHKLDAAQMLEMLGEPDLYGIQTVSGTDPRPIGPEYCVIPARQLGWKEILLSDVAIVDFGESFLRDFPTNDTGIPTPYAAPEILFPGVPGIGSDVWSLACTFYELRTKGKLFGDSYEGDRLPVVTHEIEVLLGALPREYRRVWAQRQYEPPDHLVEDPDEITDGTDLKSVFEGKVGTHLDWNNLDEEGRPKLKRRYTREEVEELAGLLEGMFKYDPWERMSLSAICEHPWIGKPLAVCKPPEPEQRSFRTAVGLAVVPVLLVTILILWMSSFWLEKVPAQEDGTAERILKQQTPMTLT